VKALFNQYTAWGCGLVILILSIIPNEVVPDVEISYIDKLAHFGMYATLSTIWFGYDILKTGFSTRKKMITIFLLVSGYGLLMETLQLLFFEGRSFEFYDIISNIIGSLIGVIIANNFFNSKK